MKEVKFSLVFRDMWQSAGKYQPRVDQLLKVAPAIIKMGCFDRVETNGGGFEQVNLLYGENPNKSVRAWTKPFHEAGIQTHMLDRALNALRMSPCPKDLRQLFYKVKKAQGTDITRIFCGLNDERNVIPSIKYAKDAGMIAQAALCITHSPIHPCLLPQQRWGSCLAVPLAPGSRDSESTRAESPACSVSGLELRS